MSLGVVFLAFGLIARITRLITDDYITGWLRAWIIGRFGPDSRTAYLVTCPWCMSLWVAGAVVPVAYYWGHTQAFLIAGLIALLSWSYALCAMWLDGSKFIDDGE